MLARLKAVALHYLAAEKGLDVWVMRAYMVIAGFLLAQTMAPQNLAFLVFLLIPFFIIVVKYAPSAKQALIHGWFMGFGFGLSGLHWVSSAFAMQQEVNPALAPYAVLALASYIGLMKGLTFWLAKKMEREGARRVIGFTAAWMIVELVQGYLFTGFPWLLIGGIWADWTVMLQLASVVGLYGMGIFTVLIAGSFYMLFEPSHQPRYYLMPFICLGLLVLWAGFGMLRLSGEAQSFHPNLKLRIVQANIDQRYKWHPRLLERHFNDHLMLSRNDSERGLAEGVDLLIWPETAVAEPLDMPDSLQRYRLSNVLERRGYALTGAPRYESTDKGWRFYNSLFVVDSNANIPAVYDKSHLVPFGEYVPFEGVMDMLGLKQLVGGTGFTEGPGPETISLPGIPSFSPLICYEIIFPDRVLDRKNRPDWLLNITNDGWFGTTSGPYQHLAYTRIRAVEEGLPIVRAAGTGISAVIDPYGRDVARMGLQRRGIINSSLPKAANDLPTLNRDKRWFQIILIAIFLVFTLYKRETI